MESGEWRVGSGTNFFGQGEWGEKKVYEGFAYVSKKSMLKSAHKTLDVYNLSLALVKMIYETTRRFPKEEQYLLVIQLRRAAISVCSNIAEGSSRISGNEKKRFYEIARSSVAEIDTQIEIAISLNFLDIREIKPLEENIESIFRTLSKMIRNLS